MEHIAPLIQTVLWVGLIGVVLWRFHTPIYGLIAALQKRVEAGSNLKAGPFELTEQLRPQDPKTQKEKAVIELEEALQTIPQDEPHGIVSPPVLNAATVQAKYFQAEDLVLRAIQAEYGHTVSRQVTAGADMGFDGAFITNGRLNIIEVKYVAGYANSVSKFRHTLTRLSNALSNYGWRNVQIILAVVFEKTEEMAKAGESLQKLVSLVAVPVIVRCYSFDELKRNFGFTHNENSQQPNAVDSQGGAQVAG